MAKENYVSAQEFIDMLQVQGLVIVSVKEYEATKDMVRKRLMMRKSLSLSEIATHRLLPVKHKKTINDWILNGKIKEEEWYRESGGKHRIMVLTSAIKRFGYDE